VGARFPQPSAAQGGARQESPFPRYVVHGQRGWLRS
jgi:hypothetical protein